MAGVSGGRDSVALLDLLLAHGVRNLLVCHLDHQLRPESSEDARFVEALASRHGLLSVIEMRNVAAHAKRRKVSIETAAREMRYAVFARVAREHECSGLFLGHHADDQVETFLFRLFRGASASGLSGMRPVTSQTLGGRPLQIARPLLGIWRKEIDNYIGAHGLAFREDVSNTDPRHARNRMRHEIIPFLENVFGREVRRSLYRASEILRAEDEMLEGFTAAFDLKPELAVPDLQSQPLALQRRIIHAWLKAGGIPEPGFDDVENVRALLDGPRSKTNLPGGNHARRRAKKLFLE